MCCHFLVQLPAFQDAYMSRANSISTSQMLARILPACVVGGLLLLLLSLVACTTGSPPEAVATEAPPTTVITSAPPATATPVEPERAFAEGAIPSGVYAMMDWGRASGAGEGEEHPWVQAGHYAFTWRQVNPEPGVFDLGSGGSLAGYRGWRLRESDRQAGGFGRQCL